MWTRHWGLSRDPFAEAGAPYVPLPSHEEASARLAYTIDSGQRLGLLRAEAGLGKSSVLRRALGEAHRAGRKIALAADPVAPLGLWNDLADRLGAPAVSTESDPSASWRRLERAVRVCTLEGRRVVLAVDGAEALWDGPSREDLYRLARLGGGSAAVLLAVRDRGDEPDSTPPWTLTIGLSRLTRSEAEQYLAAKLTAAGGDGSLFTPRAIVRLQALASGAPRGLDRLASLSLMAASSRGLEAVSSEVVDDAARECQVPLT